MKKCAYCLKRITGKPYKKGKKFFCSSRCKEEYYLNDTKTLTKELDKAMSQLVRSKGVCEASDVSSCGGELQDAHFISRSNLSLRWDIMNHLSLCYKHHFFFAHRNPFEFVLWFEKKYPERYNYLRFARTQSKKWTPEEMRETLKNIKNSNLKALVRFYKEYVVKTIRSGDKDRIQKVLRRYFEWLREEKNSAAEKTEIDDEAKRIFGVKI